MKPRLTNELQKSKMTTKKERFFTECECGAKIYGNSVLNAERNLPAHKRSKKHKELMEIKTRRNET